MKKLSALFLFFSFNVIYFTMMLFSCGQVNNNTATTKNDSSSNVSFQKVSNGSELKSYKNFLSKLDTTTVESSKKGVLEYKAIFANKPLSLCDSGFLLFNDFYERLDRNLNALHQEDTTNYDSLFYQCKDVVETPKLSNKLLNYQSKLLESGFEVSMEEGMTYIKQNRDFIATWFYPHVSPTMNKYLAQLNKENKEGFATDGGIYILPDSFVKRIIWWEDFIEANPNFIFTSNSREINKYYLTYFIIGMDNTPVYDYQNSKLSNMFDNGYQYLLKNFPLSKASRLIEPYYSAAKNNDTSQMKSLVRKYESEKLILNEEN